MKSKQGIWEISTGKGNRIYINCNDHEQIMHPESICETNGLGMYGYENLKDLAVAILLFEKERNNHFSILNQVNNG